MTRAYWQTKGGEKVPKNPDCGIEGCTRATYRQGLCRAHHAMIPLEVNLRRANTLAMELHEQGKRYAAESVRMVQAMVDA